ncbi:thiamine pyrophosphate-dependent dehydrogenase E1 component subunit alpha [Actinacidiphila glaucinigra]|uniref:Pyruvate dehydrogenase E1 component alpha subunit n=1 Tax=Actinacidiphila glaucinigra TaxID=235986 RepID=A0A239NPB9_9ACTN|nr:thiamine pyrophosphate-dependent dehydrogenase E1 component subunit alpha [Actinacidiphila glaucinigra]SNT56214.1 pyruvate dehydrogenase E1 component alpha subunit [Actinacidiphila glaucinigra]
MTLSRLVDDDLELLLLIRHFESALLELFGEGKLHGTTHTCLGQEYIPVALEPFFGRGDFVFSNHRGHGHYLSRFRDPESLLAEIMGREGAVCSGVGGSQHIRREGYLSTGVQGESLPVAAGVALTMKSAGEGALAAVYIGDGTWGEGTVYETLNMARLWCLPLVVVVENNHIAQSTATEKQMAGSIAGRASAFDIAHHLVRGNDINQIREQLDSVFAGVRNGAGPVVIEFDTNRIGPHSKGDDTRDATELARVREHDWYSAYERQHPAQFRAADERQRELIDTVVRSVESRPASRWDNS